jgi:hypothetical protein
MVLMAQSINQFGRGAKPKVPLGAVWLAGK